MDSNNLRRLVLFVSILVYVLSLTQDAITYQDIDGEKTDSSLSLVFTGAVAILGGGFYEWLIWLANPLFILALVFLNKEDKRAIGYSRVAFFVALSFVLWIEILVSEDGRLATLNSLELGYYLWIFSIALLWGGSILYFKEKERDKHKNLDLLK